MFDKEYAEEELFDPFRNSVDLKSFYAFRVIDLRHQVDQISPKKIQFFEEYRNNPCNARILDILFRQKQMEMTSDGYKVTEIKVIIKNEIIKLSSFYEKE